jgi:hypothetical protein
MLELDVEVLLEFYPYMFRGARSVHYEFYRGWMPVLICACDLIHETLNPADQWRFRWLRIREKCGYGHLVYELKGVQTQELRNSAAQCRINARGRARLEKTEKDIEEIVEEAQELTRSRCLICGSGARTRCVDGYCLALCNSHAAAWSKQPRTPHRLGWALEQGLLPGSHRPYRGFVDLRF